MLYFWKIECELWRFWVDRKWNEIIVESIGCMFFFYGRIVRSLIYLYLGYNKNKNLVVEEVEGLEMEVNNVIKKVEWVIKDI